MANADDPTGYDLRRFALERPDFAPLYADLPGPPSPRRISSRSTRCYPRICRSPLACHKKTHGPALRPKPIAEHGVRRQQGGAWLACLFFTKNLADRRRRAPGPRRGGARRDASVRRAFGQRAHTPEMRLFPKKDPRSGQRECGRQAVRLRPAAPDRRVRHRQLRRGEPCQARQAVVRPRGEAARDRAARCPEGSAPRPDAAGGRAT